MPKMTKPAAPSYPRTSKNSAQLDREIEAALASKPSAYGVDTIRPRSYAGQPLPTERSTPAYGVDTIRPRSYAGQPLPAQVHAPRRKAPSHARKKKIDPHDAKRSLLAAGIDFSRDFHTLSSDQKDLILAAAKETGYRKRKDAPGSKARMYFQYLSRLS
jgi:hypothetical protein